MENGRQMMVRMICVLLSCVIGSHVHAAIQLVAPPTDQPVYKVPFQQIGVSNPSYTVNGIPEVNSVTVSFGTIFQGQTLGVEHNSLVDTSPTALLTLDHSQATAMTMFDLARPNGGLVVGGNIGNTLYTAPLAILFSKKVNHVLFDFGHLDPNSPTVIEAFDLAGNSLGTLSGFPTGFSSVAIAHTSKDDIISGISIYVPDHTMDWEGFGISNLGFSIDDGVINGGGDPQVPEPAAWVVWAVLASIGGLGICWLQKHQAATTAT